MQIGGPPHRPIFKSDLNIKAWSMGSKQFPAVSVLGTGRSKKAAEHDAADQALLELKNVGSLAWPVEALPITSPISRQSRIVTGCKPKENALMVLEAARSTQKSERAMELLAELFAELSRSIASHGV